MNIYVAQENSAQLLDVFFLALLGSLISYLTVVVVYNLIMTDRTKSFSSISAVLKDREAREEEVKCQNATPCNL